jgi:hypothetical protein
MFLEGGLVFRCMDDDLAGEAVAEGVEGRASFALFRARAGGELGVSASDNSFGAIPFVLKVKVA